MSMPTVILMHTFQFTTSQGGRQLMDSRLLTRLSFNSRPHKEVDDLYLHKAQSLFDLSIHDLTRRSTFNYDVLCSRKILSIHDLTRRSTRHRFLKNIHNSLSIHDLTRRSTYQRVLKHFPDAFQFTTSQGGRRGLY